MDNILNDENVQLLIYFKLLQLRREKLPSLRAMHIVDFLRYHKWRKKLPSSLNQATNDILSIQADQLVSFLANQAIIESSQKKIDDYRDLMK